MRIFLKLGVLSAVLAGLLTGCGPQDSGAGAVGPVGSGTGNYAALGSLANATVSVADAELTDVAVASGTTDGNGRFAIIMPTESANAPGKLYLVTVRGGNDIDANDDGVLDPVPTPNLGALRALATREMIVNGNVNLSVLSDLAYQFIGTGSVDPGTTPADLDNIAKQLLTGPGGDINGDGKINYQDLLAFYPHKFEHKAALSFDYNKLFTPVDSSGDTFITKYHKGDKGALTNLHRFVTIDSLPVPMQKSSKVNITVTSGEGGSVTSPDLDKPVDKDNTKATVIKPRSSSSLVLTATATDADYEFYAWNGCPQASTKSTKGANTCTITLENDAIVSASFMRSKPVMGATVKDFVVPDPAAMAEGKTRVSIKGPKLTYTTTEAALQTSLRTTIVGTVLHTGLKEALYAKVVAVDSLTEAAGVLTAVFTFQEISPMAVFEKFSVASEMAPITLEDIQGITIDNSVVTEDGTPATPISPGAPALPDNPVTAPVNNPVPSIASITATPAVLGDVVTFTVTGSTLPTTGVTATLAGAACAQGASPTATSQTFSCTAMGASGLQAFAVFSGGATLGGISVNVALPTVTTTYTGLLALQIQFANAWSTAKSVVIEIGTATASVWADVTNGVSTVTQYFTSSGDKTITATMKDAAGGAGNTVGTPVTTTATVSSIVPTQTVTITQAAESPAPNAAVILSDGTTSVPMPLFSGKVSAALGACGPVAACYKVELFDGATSLGIADVTGTTWTYPSVTPPAQGITPPTLAVSTTPHSITAKVVSFEGTPGPASAAFKLTVTAPAAPSATFAITMEMGAPFSPSCYAYVSDDATRQALLAAYLANAFPFGAADPAAQCNQAANISLFGILPEHYRDMSLKGMSSRYEIPLHDGTFMNGQLADGRKYEQLDHDAIQLANASRGGYKRLNLQEPVWLAGVGLAYPVAKNTYLAETERSTGKKGVTLIAVKDEIRMTTATALAQAKKSCGMQGSEDACALVAFMDREKAGLVPAGGIPLLTSPLEISVSKNLAEKRGIAIVATATITVALDLDVKMAARYNWQGQNGASMAVQSLITADPNIKLALSLGIERSFNVKNPNGKKKKYNKADQKRKTGERAEAVKKTLAKLDIAKMLSGVTAGASNVLQAEIQLNIGVDLAGEVSIYVNPGVLVYADIYFDLSVDAIQCNWIRTWYGYDYYCGVANPRYNFSRYVDTIPYVKAGIEGQVSAYAYGEIALALGIKAAFENTAVLSVRGGVEANAEGKAVYGAAWQNGTKHTCASLEYALGLDALVTVDAKLGSSDWKSPLDRIPFNFESNLYEWKKEIWKYPENEDDTDPDPGACDVNGMPTTLDNTTGAGKSLAARAIPSAYNPIPQTPRPPPPPVETAGVCHVSGIAQLGLYKWYPQYAPNGHFCMIGTMGYNTAYTAITVAGGIPSRAPNGAERCAPLVTSAPSPGYAGYGRYVPASGWDSEKCVMPAGSYGATPLGGLTLYGGQFRRIGVQ